MPLDAEPRLKLTGDSLDTAVAGLDALDAPRLQERRHIGRWLLTVFLPPVLTLGVFIGIWQALWAAAIWPEFQLPAPAAVWHALIDAGALPTTTAAIVWNSISRAFIGFVAATIVAVPLGLLVSRVPFVRAAIGPLLQGLQAMPSVAWVPACIIWLGTNDQTIYAVVLLGAVPSIANGLVAGIDQIPPLLLRVGQALGADSWQRIRHVLLPASLPGFLAGIKQGWAFSWRSLMAAELIASSPQLGIGIGQYMDNGRSLASMATVIAGMVMILVIGIGIELAIFKPLERRVLRARGLGAAL
ncbi:ABC transporter permease [Pseudonocardiaceae bacterium YIM PH 21723]|nr:ABC transporter permease [Pseudonocardiaceae bacterium YIM PH 21723]